jgi:tetraacyldisaccharide 4'-kinase
MKAPAFWNERAGFLAWLLSPLGFIYGRITFWRMKRAGTKIRIPVICIGNFTAGGTGKTPTTALIATLLAATGETPFILSRGYGGKISGPLRVDPALHDSKDCGDEPLLLARHAPVIVSVDRLAGARLAQNSGASIIIMDDGLQNPSLEKDFTIAVVDGIVGFGNGFCLPAGPLRAPPEQQMPLVNLVLVIGGNPEQREKIVSQGSSSASLIQARLVPSPEVIVHLSGLPLLAFAGIGRPEKFFETLREQGLDLQEVRVFADHHPYSAVEIEALRAVARQKGLTLVTTQKDATRLLAGSSDIAVLPVHLELDEAHLLEALQSAIARKRLGILRPSGG